MTQHITRLTKCFFIAFFLCMATINAKADDIPSLSDCYVSNDTLNINGFYGWNAFATAYNTYLDDNTHNNFIDKNSTNYSFDDINVFCLKGDRIYIYGSEVLIQLKNIPSGKTLTFDVGTYIAGSLTSSPLYNNPYTEFTGMVGINEGTICNASFDSQYIQTKQENANSLGFGILCSENKGIIENCSVTGSNSINVYDVIENSTIMIGALAGINKGTIKNCLVSNFNITDKIGNGKTRTLLSGQIAGADISTSPNISNCCTFISNEDNTKGNNYPFVSSVWATDKYELVTDANVTWNNLSSNRVFVLCGVSSTDRLPASVASYYSEQPGGNNYSTKEELIAQISEFCNQDNCLFEYPKYYALLNSELTVSAISNSTKIPLPLSPSGFEKLNTPPALIDRDGKQYYYIDLYNTDDFIKMVQMIENKNDDDELLFYIEGDVDNLNRITIPSSFHLNKLPKGCSIIGNNSEGPYGNTIIVRLNEGDTLYPLFETIEEGAVVKNFTIKLLIDGIDSDDGFTPKYKLGLIDSSEPNTYNFGALAAVNHGTIENCRFGVLDWYMDGDDDQYSFFIPNTFNITPQENDIVRIGSLVGTNYGTIDKAYISSYPTYPNNIYSQNGDFYISNFVAHNTGKITDVVGFLSPLSNPDTEPSNLKYGYFIASKGAGSQTESVFAACEGSKCSGITLGTRPKISSGLPFSNPFCTKDTADFELLFVQDNGTDFASGLKTNYPLHFCDNPDVIKLFKKTASWSATKINDYGSYFFGVPNLTYKDLAITTRGTTEVEKQALNAFVELNNNTEYETYIELLNGNIPFYSKVDVDINSDFFLPTEFCLGIPEYPYKGFFNGKSHTLGNLCAYYDVYTTTEVDDPNNLNKKTNVLTESGILGVIGKGGKVSNLNIRNAYLGLYSNDDDIKNMDRLNFGLLAGSNAGSISNVSLSIATGVFEDCFKDDAEINTSVVGLNDNDEANTNSQASISNVAVYLANNGLLYRPAYILMYWYNDEDYNNKKTRQKLNFETLYPYWCNAVQLLILKSDFINTTLNTTIDNDDIVNPVFESFCEWFDQLSDADADAMASIITRGNFDEIDDFATLAQSLLTWYYADAQSTLRAADKGLWDAYYDSLNDDDEEGNGVAVVATQNLCKSPGKGRVHKVCSAPKSSGNKSTLLNPYDANAPEETMECTKEEFASGYAAHWLNYDDKAFTGNYNKMWSQGLLHPILASAKSPYVVKLEYYNEDNNGKGIGYTTEYPKVGATAAITYTDKPKSILVNGQLPTDFNFGASTATFTVPQTAENVGIVPVRISFDTELQPTALEPETDAQSASQLYVAGNAITVGNAAGCHITVSDLAGRIIYSQKAATDKVNITVPARGLYIVKVGNTAQKIAIK